MLITVKRTPAPTNPQQECNQVFLGEKYIGSFLSVDKGYLVSPIKDGAAIAKAKTAKEAKKYLISQYSD
ncbi:MAG: hypothetical protein PUP93_30480 [Rhizonema sp. NSF051]|nr:hypothetical protein [Rhizonema sp. NSF051]